MRGLNQTGLEARFAARMDARLEHDVDHPLAVALSGGGDSMALLGLAADWARRRGRRLLAITVDHGLNPDSARWNTRCAEATRSVGADWRLCEWRGDKPTSGLPAAARAARHALIAEAARTAGTKVVLFAHTADDVAEADWMRARGSTLGAMREWSPSPAWPEGRGLMLLRPLLGEAREALRGWLTGRDQNWIEDSANDDDRFARARARKFLNPLPADGGRIACDPTTGLRRAECSDAPGRKNGCPAVGLAHDQPFTPSRTTDRHAFGRSIPSSDRMRSFLHPLGEGFVIDRSVTASALAAHLLCASGAMTPPRGHRLAGLLVRLRLGENFTATLAGARVGAHAETVTIGREPGRSTCAETILTPDTPTVWDRRYEIVAPAAGYTVVPAAGRLNRLSDADRHVLRSVAAPLRPTLPVLIRDDGSAPILAWRVARVRALGPRRLALTLGETTQEVELHAPIHGETPPTDLFSRQELHKGDPPGPFRDLEPR